MLSLKESFFLSFSEGWCFHNKPHTCSCSNQKKTISTIGVRIPVVSVRHSFRFLRIRHTYFRHTIWPTLSRHNNRPIFYLQFRQVRTFLKSLCCPCSSCSNNYRMCHGFDLPFLTRLVHFRHMTHFFCNWRSPIKIKLTASNVVKIDPDNVTWF